jgi:phospho-N-acetylmuramoyl-pentapeptide-transferase
MNDILNISVENYTLIRTLLLGIMGFLVSMLITPLYTTAAYKWRWWKKPRVVMVAAEEHAVTPIQLHAEKHERHIPTMAGIIFLASAALVTLAFNLIREETWLPLAAFVGAGVIGLLDDMIAIRGGSAESVGLRRKVRLLLTTLVALVGGWYFYTKLDVSSIHIPLMDSGLHIGWLIVPLFVLVVVATANAVHITDGLDGLAGGLTSTAFGVYAVIAALEGRYGVAGFCLTVVGGLLSYTWFNIFPARFFMGDVGSFALGTALGVIAMITDTVVLLPIIGLVFAVEAGSSLIQIVSKKFHGGKGIFKIAPIHHHFEAIGWPETKVTMRFWIIGQVCAVLGLIVFLYGGYI